MPGIIHFEINADDPKRAVKFYEKVFGWKVSTWEGPVNYWLVSTSSNDKPSVNGAIMERMEKGAITIFVDVPSVDEFLLPHLSASLTYLLRLRDIADYPHHLQQ